MSALTPIILHTMLDGEKTAVSTLTQGEQVIFPDGSTLPQALARILAAAVESAAARIVPDIPARDTLADKYTGLQVWVRDASASAGGDPTVQRGSAKYLWDAAANEGAGSWLKVAESESMDVVVLWEAVQGIPQVLKLLGISDQGLLAFNGETVFDRRREVAVVDSAAPIPANLREGALVLERAVGGDDLVPKVMENGVAVTVVPSLRGPEGQPGRDGVDGGTGAQGLAATITVGTVTTGAPGSAAAVTNAGSAQAAVLDFAIPQGPMGLPGKDGQPGQDGAAGAPGVQGAQGATGATGPQGPQGATPPLNNTVTSTNTTEAATANAVKTAYDKAVAAQEIADSKAPGGFGLGTWLKTVASLAEMGAGSGFYQINRTTTPISIGGVIIPQGALLLGVSRVHVPGGYYTIELISWNNRQKYEYQYNNGGEILTESPSAISKHFSPAGTRGGSIAAYAHYAVPAYTVGSGRLQVWLDGILCECGGNAAQHQYQEVGAAGAWNNVIQFHDAIDGSYAISARVR